MNFKNLTFKTVFCDFPEMCQKRSRSLSEIRYLQAPHILPLGVQWVDRCVPLLAPADIHGKESQVYF